MRDYMDRRVTSPTWGPPPPCKQALSVVNSSPITFFFFQSLQTYLRETAEDLTTDKVATVLIFFPRRHVGGHCDSTEMILHYQKGENKILEISDTWDIPYDFSYVAS